MVRKTLGGPKQPVTVFENNDTGPDAINQNNPFPVNLANITNTAPLPVVPGAKAGNPAIDAFGRLRVGNPAGLFELSHLYDREDLLMYTKVANSGAATYRSDSNDINMTVTANGDEATYQSKQYFRYQPGKSMEVTITGAFGAAVSGVTKRLGFFDDSNGVFFEYTAGGIGVVKRSKVTGAVVDTRIEQVDWNLDTLDGSSDSGNPSGILLDPTKAQIFFIDLQWLGVGRIRIGFEVNNAIVYVHEFRHANTVSLVYMQSATLPIRYEITTEAGASAASMVAICASVNSNGGFDEARGFQFSDDRASSLSISSTLVPIISIRPKATFNSKPNRGLIVPVGFDIITLTNQPITWKLMYGGTLTGASWDNHDSASIVETDVTASAIADGIEVAAGYVPGANRGGVATLPSIVARYPIALDIDGGHPTFADESASDVLSLCAVRTGGSDSSAVGSLTWNEIH